MGDLFELDETPYQPIQHTNEELHRMNSVGYDEYCENHKF